MSTGHWCGACPTCERWLAGAVAFIMDEPEHLRTRVVPPEPLPVLGVVSLALFDLSEAPDGD